MVAGGLPTIQVLLDDGTGTFPYDITTRVRLPDGITITRGRSDEVSDITAGTCALTAENIDGGFTAGSTIIGSPSPIKLDTRLRVKYTPTGQSAVNRHTGYLTSLPVAFPTGSDLEARCALLAADAQARAQRRILRSVPEEEILLDAPVAYYVLGEPVGAVSAGDTSGSQASALTLTGTGAPVVFGTTSALVGSPALTQATFAGQQYLKTTLAFASPPAPLSIGFFFTTATASQAIMHFAGTPVVLGVDAGGHLLLTDGTNTANPGIVVTDGAPHLAWVTFNNGGVNASITVDNAGFTSSGVLGITLGASPTLEIGGSSLAVTGITTGAFTGTLAHVVVSPTIGGRVASYLTAGLTGFGGESDTARLSRLAGYAGIPVGSLDASLTNVAFVDITGSTDADAIKAVTDAEFGLAYVNGTGTTDFHNRNHAIKITPDATFAAEFLAENTTFSLDDFGVINTYATTAQGTGVTQLAINATSQTNHGQYPASKTWLVQTDAEALDRANWIVANHAEAQPRAGTLVLDLLTMTAAQQAVALAIEADSWVEITGLPSQTPGGTTGDFIVQGLADRLTNTSWQLTLNVVSRSLYSPVWILDDTTYSVLGSTTRLYV